MNITYELKRFTDHIYVKLLDTMTVILDKRVKSEGISQEEHDFTTVVQHILHEDIDISKSCFFP